MKEDDSKIMKDVALLKRQIRIATGLGFEPKAWFWICEKCGKTTSWARYMRNVHCPKCCNKMQLRCLPVTWMGEILVRPGEEGSAKGRAERSKPKG